jgi:3-oxoacyl-[acyl-carrier protein] reductase
MVNSLKRNALITAVSRGIGRAVALRLAAEGVTVAIGYVENESRADEILEAIRAAGGKGVAVKAF